MNVLDAARGNLSMPASACISSRIRGDTPMARLLRERDWRGTPLGMVAEWPKELVTSLNLVLGSPIATSLYWGLDHVLLYNDAYRQFMGNRHPGAIGRPGAEVWREAWHLVGPEIEQTFATGESFHREGSLVPIEQDGRMVDHYWDYTLSPVYDVVSGHAAGVYNTCVNATAGVVAERERKALAERLQQVLEFTSESVIMIGRDWRFIYLNRAAEEFSRPLGSLVGRDKWETFPSLSRETPHGVHCLRAMEHGESCEFESYYGEPINRWRHLQVRPTAEGIVLFARDITDQKRADAALKASTEALAASEEELRWTIWLSSQMTWTAAPDGMILKHTENLKAMTGHDGVEVLGDSWTELMHPDDVERMRLSWSASVQTGCPYNIEFRMHTTTGEYHWLRARAFPRRDAEGKIVKWYGITEDIDEQRRRADALERTAAALAASEEELLWTIRLSAQIPWTAQPDGSLLAISDRWFDLTGTKRDDVLGSGWVGVQHTDDVGKVLNAWSRSVESGEPFDIEHRIRLASGNFCWIRSRALPRRDLEGHIVRWYGTMEDIQARKLAEEGLRTSEKLAAVGRLATSIAHEINNPLEAVTNLLYLARTSGELPEVLDYIKDAEQELHRASVITNQTLRFQRQSSGAVALYSEDLIENCLAVFQGKLQNSSVVPERRLRALRAVTCYDGEIRQVFLNLVGNAIDAMQPGGGRLLIRTREATHPKTGTPGLVLTVADTGSGISAETRAKLFAPFFTTKGLNGTGLGLWVSLEIVGRHHGTLRLRSKPRRRRTDTGEPGGTVFTLFLPFEAAVRHPVSVPEARECDAVAA